MIIEHFAKLPPWIVFEGVEFELKLIINGRPDDIRLCYSLESVDKDSPHFERWEETGSWLNRLLIIPGHESLQGFLYLREGIETDDDLVEACKATHEFLKKYSLI